MYVSILIQVQQQIGKISSSESRIPCIYNGFGKEYLEKFQKVSDNKKNINTLFF